MSQDSEIRKTYAIIGAAMEVHNELGCGFLEGVYQDALEREFIDRRIPFVREQQLPVLTRSTLSTPYRADFVCYGSILVELKAIKKLTEIEDAQVLTISSHGYSKALYSTSLPAPRNETIDQRHLRVSESFCGL